MTPRSLAAVWLLPLAALAQPQPLLDIADPEGDDVGDGGLVYPRDSAFAEGDLDLRALRAYAEGADLRFEATFRNPIRHPSTARGPGLGSEDLSLFARRGFYAFNLDIYVDTDRVAGSGNTVTLPGRRGRIDPAHAWEKVIVLTPRPELMKRQLTEALLETTPGQAPADVAATTDASVFFATDVRVSGRTVSFRVPGSFLSPAALQGASITAAVTAAKLAIEAEFRLGKAAQGSAIDRLSLGAAQPEAGRPLYAMGHVEGHVPATAVVDLLSPDPRQQAAQLAAGAAWTGLDRANQYGRSQILALPVPALAAAPAEAPETGSWFSRGLNRLATMLGGGSAAPAAAPAATATTASPKSLQSMMGGAAPVAPAPAAAAPVAPAAPAPAAAAVTGARGAASPTATPAAPTPAAPMATPAPMATAAPKAPVAPVAAPAVAATPPTTAPAPAPAAAPVPAVVPGPAAARPAPAAPPSKARDAAYFDEQELRLRTLERLRSRGLITEAEYQLKRKEVLDGL